MSSIEPGNVVIKAASISEGIEIIGIASLNVQCRQYPGYKQDQTYNIGGVTYDTSQIPIGHYTSNDVPSKSIAWRGCAITTAGNVLGKNPVDVNSTLLNPQTPSIYQYSGNADFAWTPIDYLSNYTIMYSQNDSVVSDIGANGFSGPLYSISTIDQYLLKCNSVIIGVKGQFPALPAINSKYRNFHFVLVLGKNEQGNYLIQDPYTPYHITELPSTYQIYSYIIAVHLINTL